MTLDHYFDDFGRGLERAAHTRRRRRAPLALAAATALSAAAAIALLLGLSGGDDVVAQARTALSPPGEIVHMVVRTGIGRDHQIPPLEQWYASSPVRWRAAQEFPPRPNSKRRAERFEWAYANGRHRMHDVGKDVVTIMGGPPANGDMVPGAAGGDPATELRNMLATGDVRDDGIVTADGRQVRRLVAERALAGGRGVRQEVTYHMDPQTFAPVSGEIRMIARGKKTDPLKFRILSYERLPLNAETAKLLKVQTTERTRTNWLTLRFNR